MAKDKNSNVDPRQNDAVSRKNSFTTSDLSKIRIVPGLNARNVLEVEDLVESIKEFGLLQPLLVRRNKDPECEALWDLIGGHRRLEAVKTLLVQGHEVKVEMKEVVCSDEEMHVLMALDNMARKDFTPLEEAEIVMRFARWGWTDAEIGKRLQRSPFWVMERKDLATAAEDVKDAVKEGMPADVAAKLSKVGTEEQQREKLIAVKAATNGNWRKARSAVAVITGKKTPGKKDLKAMLQEMTDAKADGVINGKSAPAFYALEFALGRIGLVEFRSKMGYYIKGEETEAKAQAAKDAERAEKAKAVATETSDAE